MERAAVAEFCALGDFDAIVISADFESDLTRCAKMALKWCFARRTLGRFPICEMAIVFMHCPGDKTVEVDMQSRRFRDEAHLSLSMAMNCKSVSSK